MNFDYCKESFAGGTSYRVVNPILRDQFLAVVNRMYGLRNDRSAKFPGAQPCSVMRENLAQLGRDHYVVAEKTDGTRYLMLVTRNRTSGSDFVVMVDRSLTMWIVALSFDDVVFAECTLFDGELVRNEIENCWTFQIFDLIGSGSRFRPRDSYVQRLTNARTIVERHFRPNVVEDPFRLLVKRFYPTYEIDKLLPSIEEHDGCRTDGLIFTPVKLGVKPFRNRAMFKWKQRKDHTIDCLLRYRRPTAAEQVTAAKKPAVSPETSTRAVKIEPSLIARRRKVYFSPFAPADSVLRLWYDEQQRRREEIERSALVVGSDDDSGSSDIHDGRDTPPCAASGAVHSADDVDDDDQMRDSISPNKIDFGSFEFWLCNTQNDLVCYRTVNASLNRDFLEKHALDVVAGHEPVVECCYDERDKDWRILWVRADRKSPNTEYTVEKTKENIEEDISLSEIAHVVRNNRPPARAPSTPRIAPSAMPLAVNPFGARTRQPSPRDERCGVHAGSHASPRNERCYPNEPPHARPRYHYRDDQRSNNYRYMADQTHAYQRSPQEHSYRYEPLPADRARAPLTTPPPKSGPYMHPARQAAMYGTPPAATPSTASSYNVARPGPLDYGWPTSPAGDNSTLHEEYDPEDPYIDLQGSASSQTSSSLVGQLARPEVGVLLSQLNASLSNQQIAPHYS